MSSNTNMTLMASAAPNTNMMDELDPLAIGMKQFNTNILDTTISKIDFVQYFQQAHLAIFPNVDIPFMNYFMKIARSIRKFVIPHQKLIDYGVMTTEKSSNVRRCLERDNNLVIDTDFILLPPGQQIPTDDEQKEEDVLLQLEQNPDDEQKEDGSLLLQLEQQTDDEKKEDGSLPSQLGQQTGRGGSNKKQYVLTVRAFKKCLTKSRNTQRYLDYFLLLEQVISYYKDYCTRYHERISQMKDDKIDRLEAKIDHILGHTKEIKDNNTQLKNDNSELKCSVESLLEQISREIKQNEVIKKQNDIIIEQNKDIKTKLNKTLVDKNERPQSALKTQHFALLRSKIEPSEYRVIRSQASRINSELKRFANGYSVILNQYDPNPMGAFVRFKELITAENDEHLEELAESGLNKEDFEAAKIEFLANRPVEVDGCVITLNLDLIQHEDFMEKINSCLNERYNHAIQ